jgi:hypothetical protein
MHARAGSEHHSWNRNANFPYGEVKPPTLEIKKLEKTVDP